MQSHRIGPDPVLALDYFFDAPTDTAAAALRDFLAAQAGYVPVVTAYDNRWTVSGTISPKAVTLALVEQWVAWMVAAATQHGCTFDGWGAELPASSGDA
jgi:hypothetical protein